MDNRDREKPKFTWARPRDVLSFWSWLGHTNGEYFDGKRYTFFRLFGFEWMWEGDWL